MTTKQKAFHDWMDLCPVDLTHIHSMGSNEKGSTNEFYIFENIPIVEIVKEDKTK